METIENQLQTWPCKSLDDMMKVPNYHRSTQVHHTLNLHNNLIPAWVINGMVCLRLMFF
ncbi:hypothetical protein B0T13DRAFT_479254 [Neurospora crassa]|nr:hypothetical protein B0T13DRAFT_479254 [Neurospora crassa]